MKEKKTVVNAVIIQNRYMKMIGKTSQLEGSVNAQ
jgi:hypothetical protein